MEIFFYCQACDHKIRSQQLAELKEGKCPQCDSLQGFSTASKEEEDQFEKLTLLNDSEFLKKIE